MSRPLPTGYASAATVKLSKPIYLVELDWPTGTVYAWTGYGNLVWDSKTFVGTGTLGAIGAAKESGDLAANGATLSMSGIPQSLIALALRNDTQGLPGRIWRGLLADDGTLVCDPYQVFEGQINLPVITDAGVTATISIQLEKELVDNRTGARRYTKEDQQIEYPSDTFFDFIAALPTKVVTWGGPNVAASGLPAASAKPILMPTR
jgi:hypothetical protein